MTGRRVAIVEWVLAGILLIWFAVFLLTQSSNSLSLGLVITSLFFAPGLALSLAINGLVHFLRRGERLAVSEYVLLGIEALIVGLLIAASVYDQTHYGATTGINSGFGHWFEWFLPLWVLLGPVALTVMILGIVKRKPAVSAPAS